MAKLLTNRDYDDYLNSSGKTRIPGVLTLECTELSNPLDIVSGFAKYFQSVYNTSSAGTSVSSDSMAVPASCVHLSNIDKLDVEKALHMLKPKHTFSTDQIPYYLVKDCRAILVEPLTYLFNLSLKTQTFPNDWKLAKICPVLKSGDNSHIENYRPVAVLSAFSKHGFFPGRSTLTNLVCFTQFIAEHLDKKQQVNCIYLDVSKAFDTINHSIALRRLENSLIRISPTGSKQLFIMDSNLPIFLKRRAILFYADDIKISNVVNGFEDALSLQVDGDAIYGWCTDNDFVVTMKKTAVLTFKRTNKSVHFDYCLKGVNLQRITEIQDLGVTFDSILSFHPHINNLVASSLKLLGFIARTCRCLSNPVTLRTLYIALVRSKLEARSNVLFNAPIYKLSQTGNSLGEEIDIYVSPLKQILLNAHEVFA
ncbi:uncharacterized protein LOC135143827 [Zophobas morio]|uniref:uncharacterized protein LOC135143827 n=1 Tax=Zophobas morio TaxID=2755281 RepID=UPI0030834E1A